MQQESALVETLPRTSLLARFGTELILAAAVGSALALSGAGVLGSAVVILGVAILLFGLERAFPHRRDWQPNFRTFTIDFVHTLVSSHLVAPVIRTVLVFALASLWEATSLSEGFGLWPRDWPLLAQLVLAIPLADFGVYWAHRWMHTSSLGWRIHSVHHSPTQLYFMASARSHPLNVALSVASEVSLLLLFGAGPEVVSLWSVFMATNGLLQHANIDLRPGLLGRVLTTCDIHRTHHSLDPSPCNFGNMTMLWDQLFGTYRRPPSAPAEDVGALGYSIPENYWTHLGLPFSLDRFATPPDTAPRT